MKLQTNLPKWAWVLAVSVAGCLAATAQDSEFNTPGNYLIADQFNNRVIEVDPRGNIVWQFGKGPNDFSKKSIIGCNDAQRVGELTLMAGTGTPGGQPEAAPNCQNSACLDNRVLLVDPEKHIVWQYGQFGVTGSGFNQLNTPVQNTWLPNAHVLITDQGNNRIIEVNLEKEIVWHFGGASGLGAGQLNNPNCAELLENGHILICDENNNRAIEVTRGGQIVWQFDGTDANPPFSPALSGLAFASRLENGHTLITDSGNAHIVEIDRNKNVVWDYFTNTDPNSNNNRPGGGPLPTRALRLSNGDTLISDQYNHRVIEVNHAKKIVRTFGEINSLGYNTKNVADGGLNSPYDAKRIGDYTGITPPFDDDEDADDK